MPKMLHFGFDVPPVPGILLEEQGLGVQRCVLACVHPGKQVFYHELAHFCEKIHQSVFHLPTETCTSTLVYSARRLPLSLIAC